jgi:carotenoid cleavage dioxygenase-like enzyme
MTTPFPNTPDFAGHNQPARIECDIYDLVVEGTLPAEFNGSWFRSVPDPQYPPKMGDDTYLSGDGMVSVFQFENGHVDFKMRYVQTERWKNERAARRSLYGLYRNPYTDDPSVHGKGRGAANTTPIFHGGKLLASKEDSRAWELDPVTLATVGEYSYDGKLRSQTMTAHPRLDPDTGELFFFGYEAGGLATRDVAYCVASPDGRLIREEWFEAPYCALMHDFAVSKEHVIFPVFPMAAELERLKKGGSHWAWDASKETFFGVMPRDGRVEHMRWFRGPAAAGFHFFNAFTEGNKVYVDYSVTDVPVFQFIREAGGLNIQPHQLVGNIVRATFDMSKPGDGYELQVLGPAGDLPRLADKDAMRSHDIAYYCRYDHTVGPPILSGPVGAGFNVVSRMDLRNGKISTLNLGPRVTIQEPIHVPSAQPGHEGYLAFVVDQHDENLAEVVVVEAGNLDKPPAARVKLPMRLRSGVHGTWVPAAALGKK